MSLISNLQTHRHQNINDQENPTSSQGPVTRTPTAGTHTTIGYVTLIQAQRIDNSKDSSDERRGAGTFKAPDQTTSVSVFTRQEGDITFTVDGDSVYNTPALADTSNSRVKPQFRNVLYNCHEDALINPIGFVPQYEAPAQQAGGFAGVANLTLTGTINAPNRTKKPFYPGQKLMAAMPTAEIMTPHLTDREKRGEWRPILVPVDNVIEELMDLDKMADPRKASHPEARRLHRRSKLNEDAVALNTELQKISDAALQTRIRKLTKKILVKSGTNVKAASDAAIAMALVPIRENGSGLCQILHRV